MSDTDALPANVALVVGFAQLLHAHGAGTWAGLDADPYGDDVAWPIYLDRLAPDRRSIAVRFVGESPLDLSSARYRVQVLIRSSASARAAGQIAQTVRDSLHGQRNPPMPPGIRCTSIALQTHNALGRVGAWDEQSLNFTALCARASAWAAGAAY